MKDVELGDNILHKKCGTHMEPTPYAEGVNYWCPKCRITIQYKREPL